MTIKTEYTGLEVAIIGLACRVPGASNIDEFWDILIDNKRTISFFSKDEMVASGVSPEVLEDPDYISAKGVIPNLDRFDSDFFHYTFHDASCMDPQMRIMHEEVYHALEDAGYASQSNREKVGLYIGATNNFPWELKTNKSTIENDGYYMSTLQLNDKDFIATRIAYSLDLRGPCVSLHCACSTSLFAIDMAYRHIITGACDIAVAGGIGLSLPNVDGYYAYEGGALSQDGYCRPFDKDATGTVAGNGAAVVVLKNLEDAIKDKDKIYAVIKSTACNNDGCRKVGYTAPSIEGQVEVIKTALTMADVSTDSVLYVEAHGTGTNLGDPIEIAALEKAYTSATKGSIGVGSLKANIGHLDAGAGASGFIKTALTLQKKMIPATLHFHEINSQIDIDKSQFYIVSENKKLERMRLQGRADEYGPLRAGVSSFGVGGTNVHMILEEMPEEDMAEEGRAWNVLCLSANTDAALQRLKSSYHKYLKKYSDVINHWDLAWSLVTRQNKMSKRFSIAYSNCDDLAEKFESIVNHDDTSIGHHFSAIEGEVNVYFMFPGHGSQYAGMAKDLYNTEPYFRDTLEQCLKIAAFESDANIRRILINPEKDDEKLISSADVSQLTLFIIEYSLAKLLIHWGLNPSGMIGYSIGEYTAACVSGVFTIEEGIKLVVGRGKVMSQMPRGSMLSVNASHDIIAPFLSDGVSLATINTPNKCTVSGKTEEIDILEERLNEHNILNIKLETTHAAHSILMEGAKAPFIEAFKDIELKDPKIQYISNLTGGWISPQSAKSASYYGEHLRNCVDFAKGIETILSDENAVLVEVGPRKILSAFAIQTACTPPIGVVNILRDQQERHSDDYYLVEKLGELWDYGAKINWKKYYVGQKRKFEKLPMYPFEATQFTVGNMHIDQLLGQKHQIESKNTVEPSDDIITRNDAIACEKTQWSPIFKNKIAENKIQGTCLIIASKLGEASKLTCNLNNWRSIVASYGEKYIYNGTLPSIIRCNNDDDILRLLHDLKEQALLPNVLLISKLNHTDIENKIRAISKALNEFQPNYSPRIVILDTVKSLRNNCNFLTMIRSLQLEYPTLNFKVVGLEWFKGKRNLLEFSDNLQYELATTNDYLAVSYVGNERFVPKLEFCDLSANKFVCSTSHRDAEYDSLEMNIKKIWSDLFGIKDLKSDSDFFRLGGDSFKIIHMSKILEHHGYKVIMNEVFEYPTIQSLTKYLLKKKKSSMNEIITIRDLEKELQIRLNFKCKISSPSDNLFTQILILDGEESLYSDVRKFFYGLDISDDILPDFIITSSIADRLPEKYCFDDLINIGVINNSHKEFIHGVKKILLDATSSFNHCILKQPIQKTYKVSNTQRMFLKGDNRLQLYSVDFNEAVDKNLLDIALCDVIGRNGLLRSTLVRHKYLCKSYYWKEYAHPQKIDLCMIDISHFAHDSQQQIIKAIINTVWNEKRKLFGIPMYQVILIKWSERRYELFFQFDHSIVDLISGQIIRRQIISRYLELKSGVRTAMSKSIGYDEFLNKVGRGPLNIDVDSIISRLNLKEIYEHKIKLGKYFEEKRQKMQKLQVEVPLSDFQIGQGDEQKVFHIAMQVFALSISKLFDIKEVPFDLIFTNRSYGGETYSDLVGPTVDAIPFLVSIHERAPQKISNQISERIQYCVDHNISFSNMNWNLAAIWKWRKLIKYIDGKETKGQIMLNYAEGVEKEYDKIFERTLDVLNDDNQGKFDFGNFYGLAKSNGITLQFTIFSKVISDKDYISKIFEEKIAYLKDHYMNGNAKWI